MQEYRGILKRIGSKEGDVIVNSSGNSSVGNVRVSGSISVIEIGDTVLRNVGATRDIYDLLDIGEEAILYVHYHFFRKPIILGVKHPATGRKFHVGPMSLVGGAVQYLIVFPILAVIFGLMCTVIVGDTLGMLLIVAALGACLWNAVTLTLGYIKVVSS